MKLQHHIEAVFEAGTDEAGRGCLSGPVTAAAVILPKDFHHPVLNDSKQLTEKQRYMLRPIIEKEAITWAVAHVSPAEIDEINILNASILGMHRSIDQLKQRPPPLSSERRRHLHEHRRGLRPSKNLQGRPHEEACPRISAIRLGAQRGLSDQSA